MKPDISPTYTNFGRHLKSGDNLLPIEILTRFPILLTLTLQKSRMAQVRGVKGKAAVIYCEPLTTKEMGYYRLSRRVNNTVKKPLFLEPKLSDCRACRRDKEDDVLL